MSVEDGNLLLGCVMKIEELDGIDRELVVVALQALCRERVTARNTVRTTCDLGGRMPPNEEDFGIEEAMNALRRMGAML